MAMPAKEPPNRPASAGRRDPDETPVLPTRSRDDTDVGWGEPPESGDDDRFTRDRPPHWDSP